MSSTPVIKREGASAPPSSSHHGHSHGPSAAGGSSLSSRSSRSVPPGTLDPSARIIFHDAPDENTFRIMVSTDNHLGYMELDPIRKDDSFNSFKEMLEQAKANKVDFVLLGGDLFHDNKPSRSTLCRTVNILRQFTFGENPITFEIISDQSINFPTTKTVNYEDPNFNVALPIFSIHGNHDDPSGCGSYSTMDLLHSCSLLNYFGKIERVDQIVNHPILLVKGDSKLALYGMGNVRDERLHRTFESDGVRWEKPQQDPQSWFNLAVVHQNRTRHTVTQRDYLPEKFLPSWLDMVIWGHEHECCHEPAESVDGQYFVLQPGSSVATSLSGGEAVEKKVVIMEIHQDQYRTVPVPLYTTRPFIIADVKLSDDLDPLDANPAQVEELLQEKVMELIEKCKQDPRYSNPDRPELPLIRLRVEYTGFPRIANINKFGQKFVGKVANPEDLLLFSKQKKVATKKGANGASSSSGVKGEPGHEVDQFLTHANNADRDRPPPIHELVTILIRQQKGSLNVLTESKMAEMVDSYVNKKELDSISLGFDRAVKQMTLAMKDDKSLTDGVSADDIERGIRKKHADLTSAERKNHAKQEDEHKHIAEVFGINLDIDPPMREATLSETEAMEESDGEEKPKSRRKPAASKAKAAAKPRAKAAPKSKAKAPAAKGRGRKKKTDDSDEDMIDDDMDEMKEDIEDSDASGDWGTKAKSSAPSASSSRRRHILKDEDDDEDMAAGDGAETDASNIVDEDDEEEKARPSKKQRQRSPSARESAAPAVRMTVPTVKQSPSKKRPRAALALSTGSGTPASSSNFFSTAARKATPAPGSSELIDLSQAEDVPMTTAPAARAAGRPAAAARLDTVQDDAMETDGVEMIAEGWGAPPTRRK